MIKKSDVLNQLIGSALIVGVGSIVAGLVIHPLCFFCAIAPWATYIDMKRKLDKLV